MTDPWWVYNHRLGSLKEIRLCWMDEASVKVLEARNLKLFHSTQQATLILSGGNKGGG
jgi:hypothetical protein